MKEKKQINIHSYFLDGLTLLFIGLKLTGYIDWSWFWVLSPILIPLILCGIILVVYCILWIMSKINSILRVYYRQHKENQKLKIKKEALDLLTKQFPDYQFEVYFIDKIKKETASIDVKYTLTYGSIQEEECFNVLFNRKNKTFQNAQVYAVYALDELNTSKNIEEILPQLKNELMKKAINQTIVNKFWDDGVYFLNRQIIVENCLNNKVDFTVKYNDIPYQGVYYQDTHQLVVKGFTDYQDFFINE